MSKHFIFAIIGPSGVGKTTLSLALFGQEHQIVSFTSRDPRNNEKDGIDYYFIGKKSNEEIKKMKEDVKTGKLIEIVNYNGNVYGYTAEELNRRFNPNSNDAAAIVTKEGYDNLMNAGLEEYLIPVFLTASKETIIDHMSSRTDSEENKQKRIALYTQEIKNKEWFDSLQTQKILINMDNGSLEDHINDFNAQRSMLK